MSPSLIKRYSLCRPSRRCRTTTCRFPLSTIQEMSYLHRHHSASTNTTVPPPTAQSLHRHHSTSTNTICTTSWPQ
ncbi:hypothetical protein AMTR_s00060p00106860 [Amborella trichopoda]|uniref:Uncharacterized protein n=1 Tax=Amborella trichopoda TaxID=13333 RepID=W1NK08_AMBTC|nr:hypothetical protein AMTR_s00060p00106860 [Amborella trichopoda]